MVLIRPTLDAILIIKSKKYEFLKKINTRQTIASAIIFALVSAQTHGYLMSYDVSKWTHFIHPITFRNAI